MHLPNVFTFLKSYFHCCDVRDDGARDEGGRLREPRVEAAVNQWYFERPD